MFKMKQVIEWNDKGISMHIIIRGLIVYEVVLVD